MYRQQLLSRITFAESAPPASMCSSPGQRGSARRHSDWFAEANAAHNWHTRVTEVRIYEGGKGVPLMGGSVHAPSRFALMRHSLERRELTKRNNQNSLSCWLSTHGSTERLRPAASLRIEDLASEAPNRSN